MKDARLRVKAVVDDAYMHEIGLAAICFARLEWIAAYCCEKIEPGYVATIDTNAISSRNIAKKLISLAAAHRDPVIRDSLGKAAKEFENLIDLRNDLFHGKPGTTDKNEQRLFRRRKDQTNQEEWTITKVQDTADGFAAVSEDLGNHFHHILK